jgi:hypothetical protein
VKKDEIMAHTPKTLRGKAKTRRHETAAERAPSAVEKDAALTRRRLKKAIVRLVGACGALLHELNELYELLGGSPPSTC